MKKIIILCIIAVTAFSCTKNFSDINKSTYGIDNEVLKTIPIGGSQLQDLAIYVVPNQENSWQMCMDLAGCYSGYFTTPSFINDFNSYSPRTSWNDYPYTDTYENHLYNNFNPIRVQTGGDYNKPAFALASIMRVAITHRLVDMYGPLPYSSVNGVDIRVPYDTQKDIYLKMLEELKLSAEALDLLPVGYDRYVPYDKVYNGNMKMWAKYARSLMLRLAIHISKPLSAQAKEYAEYAYAKGVIELNADNALMPSIDNPVLKMNGWNDSRVGADIVEYLKAFKDPRLNAYFKPAMSRGGQPFGLRIGHTNNLKSSNLIHTYSSPKIDKNSSIVWMNAAEVCFLRAEGALKGWAMGGTPQELYEKGIKLSCEQWNVQIGNYLSSVSTRGAFEDRVNSSLNVPTFKSLINVSWEDANGDNEKQLAKIITQKWISMFPYAPIEAWTEWRRTGYPNLLPTATNHSAGLVSDITQVNGKDVGGMRRLKFALRDYKQNKENVEKALQDIGGVDTYATELWWAK